MESSELEPILHLSRGNQKKLLDQSQTERLPPRSIISAEDEQGWLTYLIEGEITILDGGVIKDKINLNSERYKSPLFTDVHLSSRAITQVGARIIQINRSLYNKFCQEEDAARIDISEVELTNDESRVFGELYLSFVNGNLQIPNFPDVALKVRSAMHDPNIGAAEISQVIQADPVLAARLMNVVNSPLYRGWSNIGNLRNAVRRLGLESTRTLAMTLAMKQLFRAKTQHIKQRVKAVYQHSTYISAIAYVLAQRVDGLDQERALLAGLLSQIGAIPILNFIDDNPDISNSPEALDNCLEKLQCMVGGILLGHWEFDAELTEIVEQADNWARQSEQEIPDYCDIVIAAHWLSYIDTPMMERIPRHKDVPALQKPVFMLSDTSNGGDLIEEAREEIDAVHQLLQS